MLAACTDDPNTASPEAAALPPLGGVYSGIFPCHDCEGIETTLWLRSDGRFFIRQRYPGLAEREPIEAFGLGRWSEEGDNEILLRGNGPHRVFGRAGPDALLLQTDSPLEHRLTRDPQPSSFTSVIRLTGTVHVVGDGALFTECLTGFTVPMAQAGDFARFRHQYRRVRGQRETIFVEFDGRFSWSNDDTAQSVIVERFVTIRETGAC